MWSVPTYQYFSVCPSVRPFVCLSVCLSVYPSIHISIHLSMWCDKDDRSTGTSTPLTAPLVRWWKSPRSPARAAASQRILSSTSRRAKATWCPAPSALSTWATWSSPWTNKLASGLSARFTTLRMSKTTPLPSSFASSTMTASTRPSPLESATATWCTSRRRASLPRMRRLRSQSWQWKWKKAIACGWWKREDWCQPKWQVGRIWRDNHRRCVTNSSPKALLRVSRVISGVSTFLGTARHPLTENHHVVVDGVHASVHILNEQLYRRLTVPLRWTFWANPEWNRSWLVQKLIRVVENGKEPFFASSPTELMEYWTGAALPGLLSTPVTPHWRRGFFLGLFRLFLFRNRNNGIRRISVPNKTDRAPFRKQNSWRDQKRPARTRNFPAKILFRPFCYREQNRNRNSSQKNTRTVYSGIGINGIVPKERALRASGDLVAYVKCSVTTRRNKWS